MLLSTNCQDITYNTQDMFSLITLVRDGVGYTDGLTLVDAEEICSIDDQNLKSLMS